MKLKDLTGQRFGRLTVIGRAGTYVPPGYFGACPTWLCKCDCGNTSTVIGRNLTTGATRSFGCLREERMKVRKSNG